MAMASFVTAGRSEAANGIAVLLQFRQHPHGCLVELHFSDFLLLC
jgi:hypothetical protein